MKIGVNPMDVRVGDIVRWHQDHPGWTNRPLTVVGFINGLGKKTKTPNKNTSYISVIRDDDIEGQLLPVFTSLDTFMTAANRIIKDDKDK